MKGRAALALAGFAATLAVPAPERAQALLAFVLLLGAAAAAALLRPMLLPGARPADPFAPPAPPEPGRVPQLEDIARDLGTVLQLGSDPHGDLAARARIVAAARLADRRGIDLDAQPERARAAVGDELAWELVRARERFEPVELPPLRAAELRRVLDALERI